MCYHFLDGWMLARVHVVRPVAKKSAMGCGTYTSDGSRSDGWTNGSCESKITRGEPSGNPCHLCPRTDLLPILPTAQPGFGTVLL